MTIKSLNIPAKLAVTFFLGSVIIGTVSALIMLGLILSGETAGFVFPSIDGIKLKYGYPRIVSAMKTSMYEYVSEDESIATVERWIREGKSEEVFEKEVLPILKWDCTKCHSKSSTMTKAMPSIPLTKYSEVVSLTEGGYSWQQMAKQAHTHMFGITVFLAILSLLMAYSTYFAWIKCLLIVLASTALWIDVLGWWLTKFFIDFVYVIFLSGAVMSGSILCMSFLVLLDLWIKVPLITQSKQ